MALFVISFLLVLTTGIFSLVLWELKQNRGEQWYLQAYAGAESGRELALLTIKQKWYGYYDSIAHEISNKSSLLAEDRNNFKKNKDVFISYDLAYKVSRYSWSLAKFEYDIIPLYWEDESGTYNTLSVTWELEWWSDSSKLLWNIIWEQASLAGFWEFWDVTLGKSRTLDVNNNILYDDNVWIQDFLETSDQKYLIIFNAGSEILEYSIASDDDNYFTLPRTDIISSAQVGKYKQNLRTRFDNTEFLDVLKYSIFSPNNTN